jgi:acyl-CoA thioesterase-1
MDNIQAGKRRGDTMGVTVALGDSLTYGYPYSPGSSWVSLAAKKLGITIYNRGINGDTSLDMLARLEPDVLSLHPDIVIILAGSNDALGYKGVIGWRETKKALLELKSLIEAAGGKVIFVLPPPVDEPLAEARLQVQRKWLQEEAAGRDYDPLDFYIPLLAENKIGIRPEFTVDGLHPNKSGYKVLAQAAVTGLKRLEPVMRAHKQK